MQVPARTDSISVISEAGDNCSVGWKKDQLEYMALAS